MRWIRQNLYASSSPVGNLDRPSVSSRTETNTQLTVAVTACMPRDLRLISYQYLRLCFFFFCEGVSSFVHTAVLKLNVFRLLGCTYVSVDDCMASTRNSIHFHFPEKENRIFIFTSAWFREEGLKWLNRFHFTEKEKR